MQPPKEISPNPTSSAKRFLAQNFVLPASRTMLAGAVSLGLATTSLGQNPINLDQVAGVWTPGDIGTLTISEDGTRAFVVEGGAIRELSVATMAPSTGGPVVYAEDSPGLDAALISLRPIEASVMDMIQLGDSLLVAGGSYGVLVADVSDPTGTPPITEFEVIDPEPWTSRPSYSVDAPQSFKLWCMDLCEWTPNPAPGEAAEKWALALHASRFGAHIQVLRVSPGGTGYETFAWVNGLEDAAAINRFADDTLQKPFAYAVAVQESIDQVYVAMGTGGVTRMDFSLLTQTMPQLPMAKERRAFDRSALPTGVIANPDLGFDLTHPYSDQKARVRDVAIVGDHLYLTADDLGVISYRLPLDSTHVWNQGVSEQVMLSFEHRNVPACTPLLEYNSFAVRLSTVVDGDRVLVVVRGDNNPVKTRSEAAPAALFGRWMWTLEAGVFKESFKPASSVRRYSALYILEDPTIGANDMSIATAIARGEGRNEYDMGCQDLLLLPMNAAPIDYGVGRMEARVVAPGAGQPNVLRVYRTTSEGHALADDREAGFIIEDYSLATIDAATETTRETRGAFTIYSVSSFSAEPSLVDENILFVTSEPSHGFNPVGPPCITPPAGGPFWTRTGLVEMVFGGTPVPPPGQSYSLSNKLNTQESGIHGLWPMQANWKIPASALSSFDCMQQSLLANNLDIGADLDATLTGRSDHWRFQLFDVLSSQTPATWRWNFFSPAFARGASYRGATRSRVAGSDTVALFQHRVRLGGAVTTRRDVLDAIELRCDNNNCDPTSSSCCSIVPDDCTPSGAPRPACVIAPALKLIETHPEIEGVTPGQLPDPMSTPTTTDVRVFGAQLGEVNGAGQPILSEIALYSCGFFYTQSDSAGNLLSDFSRGMIAIVDLTDTTVPALPVDDSMFVDISPQDGNPDQGHLRPLALGISESLESNIIRTEIVELDGHRFALCSDAGGSVIQFDISDDVLIALKNEAENPFQSQHPWRKADNTDILVLPQVSSWRAQRLRSDGTHANIFDVVYEKDETAAGRHYLYVTDVRSGIYRLTLGRIAGSSPPTNCGCATGSCEVVEDTNVAVDAGGQRKILMQRLILPEKNNPNSTNCNGVEFFDTPGLPHFFTLRYAPGADERRLFLGDKKNGLRVYTNE